MGIIKASKLIYDYIRRDEDEHIEEVSRAIDGLTLDIQKGDFVAILGHNGSGKSTFAKQINAILLPTVMAYNAEATGEKYREIARAMGVEGVDAMTQEEYRKAAIDAVRTLSIDVGIPTSLKEIVKEEDLSFLADSAMADACRPGNPKEPTKEDIIALYRSLM